MLLSHLHRVLCSYSEVWSSGIGKGRLVRSDWFLCQRKESSEWTSCCIKKSRGFTLTCHTRKLKNTLVKLSCPLWVLCSRQEALITQLRLHLWWWHRREGKGVCDFSSTLLLHKEQGIQVEKANWGSYSQLHRGTELINSCSFRYVLFLNGAHFLDPHTIFSLLWVST